MTPLELVLAGGLGISLFTNIAQWAFRRTARNLMLEEVAAGDKAYDKLHERYSELWTKIHHYRAAVDHYFTNISPPERKEAKAKILAARAALFN